MEGSSLTWLPKVTHEPKLNTDTFSPVRPRCLYSIGLGSVIAISTFGDTLRLARNHYAKPKEARRQEHTGLQIVELYGAQPQQRETLSPPVMILLLSC